MRSKLVRGATWALVIKVAGLALAFAVQIVLARSLGAAGLGVYALAIGWVSVLALVGKLGLEAAAQRFLPEYETTARPDLARAFVRVARRWTLVASVGVAAAASAAVLLLPVRIDPGTTTALLIGFATLPLLARLQLLAGFLQAGRRVVASQAPLLVGVPLVTLAGLAVVFGPAGVEPDVRVALIVFAGAVAACLTLSALLQRGQLSGAGAATDRDRRRWLAVGASLLLSGGFGAVLAYADVLMLGPLAGSEETGLYSAAARLARLVELPLMAVGVVAAPLISELHHGRQRERLQRLARQAALAILGLTLPVVALLVLGGEQVLALFGEEFVAARTALTVLLVGKLISAAAGPVGHLLSLTGGHRTTAGVLGASALANLVLNALLIPVYGLLGAAVATTTTTAFWNVAMYAIVRRRLGVKPSFF